MHHNTTVPQIFWIWKTKCISKEISDILLSKMRTFYNSCQCYGQGSLWENVLKISDWSNGIQWYGKSNGIPKKIVF